MQRNVGLPAVVAIGLLLGLLVVEIGLRWFGPGFVGGAAAAGSDRMYYLYTDGGLGKCYPSDPRNYFPIDWRDDEVDRALRPTVDDIAGLPDEWSVDRKIDFLRKEAPFCNDMKLAPLNRGSLPERERRQLIIGDSFGFGEGLRLEDTIGFRLSVHDPRVNFPNMSWPGATIETIYDVSRLPGKIEQVVYLFNLNDVLMNQELDNRQYELFGRHRMPGEVEQLGVHFEWCSALAICRLIRSRDLRTRRSQAAIEFYRDLYFSTGNQAQRRKSFARFDWMRAEIEKQGAELVVVLFPLFYRPPLSDYPFRDIHELVQGQLDERGIRWIDLLPLYEEYLWWDRFMVHPLDRHPSAEAIDLAAAYLAPKLTER